MPAAISLFLIVVTAFGQSSVLDRIAAIVGKQVIKLSDIERDLRLTEFLNRQPLSFSAQRKRESAEHLIDQQIIRSEIASQGYARASDAEAENLLRRIQRDRFANSSLRLNAELTRYGLTPDDLREQLLWQLTVLQFIQQRFQAEVSVADQDVHNYYDAHLAELRRQHGSNVSYDAVAGQIRSTLEAEQVNKVFEDWLANKRQNTRIEYREGAFQ
jgi:hypothetical protein